MPPYSRHSGMSQLCLSLLLVLMLGTSGSKGIPRELDWRTKLAQDLFTNYTPDVLPLCVKSSEIVTVNVDLALRGILDVDEPRQVLTSTAWQRWKWNDCRLKWNASEYGGLTSLIISADRLWIPDVIIWDSADDFDGAQRSVAILDDTGHVYLLAPAIIKIACKIDITYFPFDRQACRIMYVSSSYTGRELNLVNKSDRGDVSLFLGNGEWDLVGIPAFRTERKYPCCDDPFPDVTYYLVIQRQPLYYIFNLVMPCLFISGISLLLFYLPPDSGEKISMGITVLLSLCVFLLMVSERMPATSETVPLIGQYFGATIILVSLSCAMTVIVLHIHHSGANGKEVPRWLRTLTLDWLARLFCMDTDLYDKETLEIRHSKKSLSHSHSDPAPEYLLSDDGVTVITDGAQHHKRQHQPLDASATSRLEMLMEKQITYLRQMDVVLLEYQKESKVKSDWRKVAMVVDRALLLLMCVTGTTVCAAIFLFRPNFDGVTAEDTVASTIDL